MHVAEVACMRYLADTYLKSNMHVLKSTKMVGFSAHAVAAACVHYSANNSLEAKKKKKPHN